jgi:superfamily II DNA or RNA helicase
MEKIAPFKSDAQRKWMFAAEDRGEVPKGTADRWAKHTKNIKKLPEYVKKANIDNIFLKFAKQINLKLLQHQQEAVDKYKKSNSILLYHGIGSGKTATSIAATSGDSAEVVVPASLRENFKKELKKFNIKNDYKIKSYHHFAKYGPESGVETIIIDEPQKIGRTSSAISQKMVESSPQYKKRILLSATPASNNPAELAPIIRFLNPDNKNIPLNPTDFNKKFIKETIIPIGFYNRLMGMKPGIEENIKNPKIISEAIKCRVHYYEPSNKNFPERIDHEIKSLASPEQIKYYNYVTSNADPVIAKKIRLNLPLSKQESKYLNAFMAAVRQVSNTTVSYGGSEELSPKMKSLVNNVKSNIIKNPNHKNLIYSNYLNSGILPIAKKLDSEGIKYKLFTGSMNDKEKKEAVGLYNKDKINALLISGAGAEGIDLKNTGSVHILEPHWNKNKIEQVVGRGIRYKSHESLPQDQRKVDVYKYQTILPKTFFQKLFNLKRGTSADEALEELSNKKQLLLDKFLNIFKEEGLSKSSFYINSFQKIAEKLLSSKENPPIKPEEKIKLEINLAKQKKLKGLSPAEKRTQDVKLKNNSFSRNAQSFKN